MIILVADDSAESRSDVGRILRREGHTVILARNGAIAKELLAMKPDVLISDLDMPQVNGLELLYFAKKNYPDTMRIIMSSAFSREALLDIQLLDVKAIVEKSNFREPLIPLGIIKK